MFWAVDDVDPCDVPFPSAASSETLSPGLDMANLIPPYSDIAGDAELKGRVESRKTRNPLEKSPTSTSLTLARTPLVVNLSYLPERAEALCRSLGATLGEWASVIADYLGLEYHPLDLGHENPTRPLLDPTTMAL